MTAGVGQHAELLEKIAPHRADRLSASGSLLDEEPAPRSTVFGWVLLCLLGFSLLLNVTVICTELTLSRSWIARLLLVLPGALALVLPRLALMLFLAALPIFGNKPGSAQMIWLTYITSSVIGGTALNLLSTRRAYLREIRSEPSLLIGLAGAYLLVSLLSLSSLPLVRFVYELDARAFGGSWTGIAALLHQFLRFDEDNGIYPVLSVFLTSQGVLVAALLYGLGRAHPRFPLHALGAVLAGLVLALVAGLLDYYGVIELRSLRKLDPYANPWNAQFRIQSFFGHSGWFAEYVTLAVPSVLVLLSLRARFWVRVGAVLAVLLAGEYVLILTFQRGGWLSYPLTLVAVWAAIYVGRRLEQGDTDVRNALRRSAVKVALSLPITVLATAALMFGLARTGLLSAEVKTTSEMYVDRLKDISKTGDRTKFFVAGTLIGSLHPFLGAGSESFATAFEKEFEKPGGRYKGLISLPLHGTAHNVYAQTFAGKGMLGLALLVALAATLILEAAKSSLGADRSSGQRLVLLGGACTGAAFLIYGVVQEVFYIQSLQLLFFGVIGITAGVLGRTAVLRAATARRITFATLFFLAGHLVWELVLPGRAAAELAPPAEYGCYRRETDRNGQSYRWCTARAAVRLPVSSEGGTQVARFGIRADRISGGRGEATLTVSARGKELLRTVIPANELKEIVVPLGADAVPVAGVGAETADAAPQVDVTLELDSRFIPHFALDRRGDYRLLSFRYFPPEGDRGRPPLP